jgi:hypothetical protein
MIRMHVLGLRASHLLVIRPNLGYGTVLTAACARQGCGASVLVLGEGGLEDWLVEANVSEKHAVSIFMAENPEEEDSTLLRNIGFYRPVHTAP